MDKINVCIVGEDAYYRFMLKKFYQLIIISLRADNIVLSKKSILERLGEIFSIFHSKKITQRALEADAIIIQSAQMQGLGPQFLKNGPAFLEKLIIIHTVEEEKANQVINSIFSKNKTVYIYSHCNPTKIIGKIYFWFHFKENLFKTKPGA